MMNFIHSTGCVNAFCAFVKSLSSYDMAYYGLAYLAVMVAFLGLLYKQALRSLKYFYSVSLIFACFSVVSYQLLLLGTINLSALPISLKIFISSLLALVIYTSLCENKNNKNLAFELAPVSQKPNTMNTKTSKEHTYNYNYNNDNIYSEPNTTNAKTNANYGYNYIDPKISNEQKVRQEEKTNCQKVEKPDNASAFSILNEKINDKTMALQEKISNIKSRLEAMEERKQVEIENQLLNEIRTIKSEVSNLKRDIVEMEFKFANEQTKQNETQKITETDKKLEKIIQDNQQKFACEHLHQKDFGQTLSNKIDHMMEEINKQKVLENQKIHEENIRQASEIERKYKAQLRNFEQQLKDIDEQINQNEKLEERAKQINVVLNKTPIINTEILPALSIKNTEENNTTDNIDDTTTTQVADNMTTNVEITATENTNNSTSAVISPEQQNGITNDILVQTKDLIQQSISPINEKIAQLEINMNELNNGLQGIIDRVAKLLEFMTTTIKKTN